MTASRGHASRAIAGAFATALVTRRRRRGGRRRGSWFLASLGLAVVLVPPPPEIRRGALACPALGFLRGLGPDPCHASVGAKPLVVMVVVTVVEGHVLLGAARARLPNADLRLGSTPHSLRISAAQAQRPHGRRPTDAFA